MPDLPTISIVTCTYNPDPILFEDMLKRVKSQKYPKGRIEHIVIDAGSTNGSIELARSYHCHVMVYPDLVFEEQARASIGIKKATGKLILILESDNLLTGQTWLQRMVEPFQKDKSVVLSFSIHNSYEKNMSLTTRYCALFGFTDPVVYYLDKSEKIPMGRTAYRKGIRLGQYPHYYLVKFTPDTLPTLGDNGHMIRRSVLAKVNKNPHDYAHTDAVYDLVGMGYDTFGAVKNSIIHVAKPSFVRFITRKVEVKKKFYDYMRKRRSYLVFNPGSRRDWFNLMLFVLFSLTIIVPLAESVRGYIKIRDRAWFLHPVVCFIMVFAYGLSEIHYRIKKIVP